MALRKYGKPKAGAEGVPNFSKAFVYMGFTKHWAKMKNWMENQEDSLVRIKCEVSLNLGMGNYYLYFHCKLQVFSCTVLYMLKTSAKTVIRNHIF